MADYPPNEIVDMIMILGNVTVFTRKLYVLNFMQGAIQTDDIQLTLGLVSLLQELEIDSYIVNIAIINMMYRMLAF